MLKAVEVEKRGVRRWKVELRHGGKRHRVFRATKTDALQAGREWLEAREAGLDGGGLRLAEMEFLAWLRECGLAIGEARRILERELAAKSRTMTVAKACAEYLAAPRAEPLSAAYLGSVRGVMKKFTAAFGERTLAGLAPGEIADFVQRQGRNATTVFSRLRTLFHHAHLRRWIEENAFERLAKPDLAPTEKALLTPEQMRRALRIAAGVEPGMGRDQHGPRAAVVSAERYEPVLRALIVGGFCGLRPSEVARLDCADIDVAGGEIHVRRLKTQRRGMRERFPELLPVAREWLAWLALPASGPLIAVSDANFRRHRDRITAALGLEHWPDRAERRSFASYRRAVAKMEREEGEADRETAEAMGHTDPQTTLAKYAQARRKRVALAWFALTPAAVLDDAPARRA